MEEQQEAYWGPKLWTELRSLDPPEVCKRCLVEYDEAGFYTIPSLGMSVNVYPKDERIETPDAYLNESVDYQLLLVSFLLKAQGIDPVGQWVSEKDITGGSTFFRGPHALPSAPIEAKFGDDPEGFLKKASLLGATKGEFGDVSAVFPALPRISFIIVLWVKDEEFPARATFMMDYSIDTHLPLDVISAMTVSVTGWLVKA